MLSEQHNSSMVKAIKRPSPRSQGPRARSKFFRESSEGYLPSEQQAPFSHEAASFDALSQQLVVGASVFLQHDWPTQHSHAHASQLHDPVSQQQEPSGQQPLQTHEESLVAAVAFLESRNAFAPAMVATKASNRAKAPAVK